jgi:hypothetical protein
MYYEYMSKTPLSVTLQADNITWLKARARALGTRGVSGLLDQIVTDARRQSPGGAVRSVVGTIDLDPSDPLLMGADEVLRAMVDASIARPAAVKERKAVYSARGRARRG